MKNKFKSAILSVIIFFPFSSMIATAATAHTSAPTANTAKTPTAVAENADAAEAAAEAASAAGLTLATSKNCLACHAVTRRVVGPSFKEVAAKYEGQSDASAKLVDKVMKGGAGVWGAMPMPSNNQVNAEEARKLVEWVLSTK